MKFQCPICGKYNTFVEDMYHENDIGACFDCMKFFTMSKTTVNWTNVRNFLILFISSILILYFSGVLK